MPCSTASTRPRDGRFGTSLFYAMLGTKYSDMFVRKLRQSCLQMRSRLLRQVCPQLNSELNLALFRDFYSPLFGGLFE